MTLTEAYELLDLSADTDLQQVRQRFSEHYSEYRMLIDNAPTPALRKKNEQNLALREEAFALITGGASLDDSYDLPSSTPHEQGTNLGSKEQSKEKKSNSTSESMSVWDALELLGLKKSASSEEITTAYSVQKAKLEQECQKTRIESVKEAYKTELNNLEQVWEAIWQDDQKLILKEENGKWGYIDKIGKIVIDFKYEDADDFFIGTAWVQQNGQWGLIDRTEKLIIGFKYESVLPFFEGIAPVELHSKWGYIDRTGKIVIDFKYEDAANFSQGLATVGLNGERFKINKLGERVAENNQRSSSKENLHFNENRENTKPYFIWVKPFTITVSVFFVYILSMFFIDDNFLPLLGPLWIGVMIVTFIFCKKNNALLPFLKTYPNVKASLYTITTWWILFPLLIMALGAISRL
jgi:hypothetical protein